MENQELIIPQEYITYAEHAYPSNHTFKIKKSSLTPKCKLGLRYRKIQKLYPSKLTSLVDLSASKGFFVFSASTFSTCHRSLGVDINEYDIIFCNALKKYLQNDIVEFKLLRLHELAKRIDEFGGAFQTVLLINAYQYFYFGSSRSEDCYLSHEKIFEYLSQICSQRIIFNNRIDLIDCQNKQQIQLDSIPAKRYTKEAMLTAAAKYFHIQEHGKIGQYPLLTLDRI